MLFPENLFAKDNIDKGEQVEKDIQISNIIEDNSKNEIQGQNDSNQDIEDIEKYVRYDSQGNVDVGVMFKNLAQENKENLQFEVMLNTHSVDLEGISYADLVGSMHGINRSRSSMMGGF